MRKIQFRGKRLDTCAWVVGWLAGLSLIATDEPESTLNATDLYYDQEPYVGFTEVRSETVGQYIGFEDMNGKPIFEGDIVRYHKPLTPWGHNLADGTEGVVDFSGGAFYMAVRRTAAMTDLYLLNSFFGAHGSIIEVIGNIYDKEEYI